MAGPVRAVVVVRLELGALLAVDGGPVEHLVAHVGGSGAGLTQVGSGELESVVDVDIGRVSSEGGIGTAVLLGEVQRGPPAVGSTVVARLAVVLTVLELVHAPGRVCALDQIADEGEFVGVAVDAGDLSGNGRKSGNEGNGQSGFRKEHHGWIK